MSIFFRSTLFALVLILGPSLLLNGCSDAVISELADAIRGDEEVEEDSPASSEPVSPVDESENPAGTDENSADTNEDLAGTEGDDASNKSEIIDQIDLTGSLDQRGLTKAVRDDLHPVWRLASGNISTDGSINVFLRWPDLDFPRLNEIHCSSVPQQSSSVSPGDTDGWVVSLLVEGDDGTFDKPGRLYIGQFGANDIADEVGEIEFFPTFVNQDAAWTCPPNNLELKRGWNFISFEVTSVQGGLLGEFNVMPWTPDEVQTNLADADWVYVPSSF